MNTPDTPAPQGGPEPEPLSKCCHAPMRVVSADEGTCYHACTQCGEPTDAEGVGSQPPTASGETPITNRHAGLAISHPHFAAVIEDMAKLERELAEAKQELDVCRYVERNDKLRHQRDMAEEECDRLRAELDRLAAQHARVDELWHKAETELAEARGLLERTEAFFTGYIESTGSKSLGQMRAEIRAHLAAERNQEGKQ